MEKMRQEKIKREKKERKEAGKQEEKVGAGSFISGLIGAGAVKKNLIIIIYLLKSTIYYKNFIAVMVSLFTIRVGCCYATNLLIIKESSEVLMDSLVKTSSNMSVTSTSNSVELLTRTAVLPQNIKEALTGNLLGDGSLQKYNSGFCRFRFQQGGNNSEYLYWTYNNYYKSMCKTGPQDGIQNYILKNNLYKQKYWFNTISYKDLGNFYDFWYDSATSKKIVPLTIEEFLTPVALAQWYQDDGTVTYNTYILCTNSFSKIEVQFLSDILQKKYGIFSNVHMQYEDYRLYIQTKSAERFSKIIQPYMCPSMIQRKIVQKHLI